MTWSLDANVEAGEVVNTNCNQVHGWLRLRGLRRPLYLHLSGNASPSLAGRRVLFESATAPPGPEPSADWTRMARQQIGPSGAIEWTGENPRELRLEWFGQNGHVELRVADPLRLEVSELQSADALALSEPTPTGGWFGGLPQEAGPGFRRPETCDADDWSAHFDLLDQFLESEAEQPIGSLVTPPLELPARERLTPLELHRKLKEALARLALLGVCVDLCEHFTVPDAYELVRDKIWWEETTHPELVKSGYLMHYLTFEHCRQCRQEEQSWVGERERLAADEDAK